MIRINWDTDCFHSGLAGPSDLRPDAYLTSIGPGRRNGRGWANTGVGLLLGYCPFTLCIARALKSSLQIGIRGPVQQHCAERERESFDNTPQGCRLLRLIFR